MTCSQEVHACCKQKLKLACKFTFTTSHHLVASRKILKILNLSFNFHPKIRSRCKQDKMHSCRSSARRSSWPWHIPRGGFANDDAGLPPVFRLIWKTMAWTTKTGMNKHMPNIYPLSHDGVGRLPVMCNECCDVGLSWFGILC